MDWGGFEQKLKAKGVAKKRPELYGDLVEVWEAFLALNSSRIITREGVRPIPYSEINAWLDIHRIQGDTREEYAHLLRILDRAFLEKVRNKNAES